MFSNSVEYNTFKQINVNGVDEVGVINAKVEDETMGNDENPTNDDEPSYEPRLSTEWDWFNDKTMDKVHPFRVTFDVVVWLLICIPVVVLHFAVYPFVRGFYCDDESIRYPYKESTVTNVMLYVFGFSIPILTILAVEAYRTFYFEPIILGQKVEKRSSGENCSCHPYVIRLYYYIGYFLFGAAICQVLTDIGKYTIGRLRPHFIDVCKPAWDQIGCNNYSYIIDACTGDPKLIKEARLSFPSGHSSFSFYSMLFTTMYVQAQIVWPMLSRLVKTVMQFVFICLAVICSLSRISDYKHHWSDVLSGSVLGISVASFTAIYMVGLFRYPKQQIFVDGIVAPNAVIAGRILKQQKSQDVAIKIPQSSMV